MTPYELIAGHKYNGKLCEFGCPVMVYVGDSVRQKGDAKWRAGVFIGKTLSNDMYLTAVGGVLKLTRSMKALFPNWSEHIIEYRQILTFPWELESTIGNRIVPTLRGQGVEAIAVPPIDDEMAEDPPDEPLLPSVVAELVPLTPQPVPPVTRRPPPATAVVSDPNGAGFETSDDVQPHISEQQQFAQAQGAEQAGLPVPSLEPPGPTTPGLEDVPVGEAAETDMEEAFEPDAKRPRLSVMRIGDETLCHMDVNSSEYMSELGDAKFPDEFFMSTTNDDTTDAMQTELTEDDLWQPFSALEPSLTAEELKPIDEFADKIEIERLFGMGVLTGKSDFSDALGSELSARFVRSWRKKTRKQLDEHGKVISATQGWLRHSRLVAREFSWLDARDDVYSPSSSSAIVKLLPALALSGSFCPNSVLGTLDIGDAFLQVPQPLPQVVRLGREEYVILRCLPGQRDAAKLWYQFFLSKLQQRFSATVCTEQPCVLRVGRKLAMVIHVDDILFLGEQTWVEEVFLPGLEQEFKLSYAFADRASGGSFEFLKRLHLVEPEYSRIVVVPESKYVHNLFERFSVANGKSPKLCKTPCIATPGTAVESEALVEALSGEYRSLVGIAMYVSQERFDIQFATKSLAAHLKNPTRASWLELGRLIGYLKYTEGFALEMKSGVKGATFLETLSGNSHGDEMNCLETFSDADWSGTGALRSTSSAVHVLNGVIVHSTSRSQRCISLSSTESEWYAASAGTCDGLFLHHVLCFLLDDEVRPLVLHTDNSAVRMLSMKLGAGRLRHIRGRLLWLQEKASSGELIIKQVKTNQNIADLNTKPLQRDRFFSLLYMFGFVSDGDSVGENEFTRMQAKELMKQQVRIVSEALVDQNQCQHSGKVNKLAKQILRIIASCSLFTLVDGQKASSDHFLHINTSFGTAREALGHWLAWKSPITIIFCICFFLVMLAVVFMARNEGEPEPEEMEVPSDDDDPPAGVTLVCRYPTNERSLARRYESVFEHVFFKPEGILLWMHSRCEGRVNRGVREARNAVRRDLIASMIRECRDGLEGDRFANMSGNTMAMTDLTDDENCPNHNISQDEVLAATQRFQDAFDAAMEMYERRAAMSSDVQPDAEEEPENSESSESEEPEDDLHENDAERLARYMRDSVDQVSDPEYWFELHYGE